MQDILNKYQREFASHVVWDPAEEGLTPHVEISRTKATHVVKRYVQELGREKDFTAKTGDTLYKSLQGFFFGELVCLMADELTVDDLLPMMDQDKLENGKYPFVRGASEETVDFWRKAQGIITEVGVIKKVESSLGELTIPDGPSKTAIDSLLAGSDLPEIDTILDALGDATRKSQESALHERDAVNKLGEEIKEVARLSQELRDAAAKALSVPAMDFEIEGTGEVPDGKVTYKKASEVFKGVDMVQDFEVPVWEWDGVHPDVPKIDKHYIFRPDYLIRVIYSIVTNKRAYLQGHTGSGKTTLIEQVAARLGYPFVRVNFDSEISRMDLIGRDTLKVDADGRTVSEFVDGMLPRAMSAPCILCCDEIDFVRPDVAYVMQAALEGNGLRITEDGDRLVKPHPMMRMFATGNTVGQGDEEGMYQGARPQSLALLDRFTVWLKVDYLTDKERRSLVKRVVPALKEADAKVIGKYVDEHLAAFENGDILQPISPRGMLAFAEATVMLGDTNTAFKMVVLDKANKDERSVLKGIADRVIK